MQWMEGSEIMQAAINIAVGELGVTEDPLGSNKGQRIEEYLAAVGLPGGYAWCGAFVSWCITRTEAAMKVCANVPKSGWTADFLTAPGCVLIQDGHPRAIAPGMLFLLYYPRLNRVGHVGFIEAQHPAQPGRVLTIEGNSNDDVEREGYEVCRRSRPIESLYALISY